MYFASFGAIKLQWKFVEPAADVIVLAKEQGAVYKEIYIYLLTLTFLIIDDGPSLVYLIFEKFKVA